MRPEISRSEILPSREKVRTNFSVATISGRSGTGKTATGELLAGMLGISRYAKTGERFRELTGLGGGNRFTPREISVDEALDAWQKEKIESASKDNPVILEGRLAALVGDGPDIVRMLFTAPADVRMARIYARNKKERDVRIADLDRMIRMAQQRDMSPEIVSSLYEDLVTIKGDKKTLAMIRVEERGREQGDLEQWRKIHPELIGVDPFDPTDKLGMYDLIVQTGKLTAFEVALQIYGWLGDNGHTSSGPSDLSLSQGEPMVERPAIDTNRHTA